MGEWFSKAGIAQFACSETQKYGHVTYFWNGNRSGKFEGETYQEVLRITSYNVCYTKLLRNTGNCRRKPNPVPS